MDNDKSIKRKTSSMIAKNLILLLSVALTGVIGAWSWFSNNTEATAEGISVKCEAPDGVEIAVVEHGAAAPVAAEYKTSLTLDSECAVLKNLKLTEVTSDGILFQKPLLEQKDGEAKPVKGSWDGAYEGRDYICFDLYIRSTASMSVRLDATSSIEANSAILTGESSGNKSDKGDFSRDCIVGATRTSVLAADGSTKKLLWIPRPDIRLVSDKGTFSIETGITDTNSETYKHSYWDINQDEAQDLTAVTSVINGTKIELGQDIEITTLTEKNTSDGYYYNHVVYNVWIEGEDSEARLALAGGQFTMNIQLSGDKIQTE